MLSKSTIQKQVSLINLPIHMWFATWGGVTDPHGHTPENFRYLVHSFKPCSKFHMEIMHRENSSYRRNSGKAPYIDSSYGDQTINLVKQPERLSERVSLSMSLIDAQKRSTFGAAGIIVEAPEVNILATSHTDMLSMNGDPEFLKKQAIGKDKLCGDNLLKRTNPAIYNEVVAFAKVGDDSLKLKGFFVKKLEEKYLNPVLARKMEIHAERLKLPLVQIEESEKYKSEDIVIAGNDKLAVHLGGKIFLLSGWERQNFQCIDEDKKINFIEPEQFFQVLEFLISKKVDKNTIMDVNNQYSLISKQRQKGMAFNNNDNSRYK